jgi:hypothetical protein
MRFVLSLSLRSALFCLMLCYVVICDLSVPVSNDRMAGVLQRDTPVLSPGVEYSAVRTGRGDGNGDDGL